VNRKRRPGGHTERAEIAVLKIIMASAVCPA